MLKITLTDKARSDLAGVQEYYAGSCGTKAANRIIMEMLRSMQQLSELSGLGRPAQSPGVRELVFTHYPYVAPYRVKNDTLQVLRILHQRTDR